MSFSVIDLQALPEREPAGNAFGRSTNCEIQSWCCTWYTD
jgi:hypothetical protein